MTYHFDGHKHVIRDHKGPWLLLVCSLIVVTTVAISHSGNGKVSQIPSSNGRFQSSRSNLAQLENVKINNDEEHTIRFHGISITYSSSLATDVRAEVIQAISLEYESDKPDSVTPQHIQFTLIGNYPLRHQSSFFAPEIHIYPVDKYEAALSVSPRHVEALKLEVKTLKSLLARRKTSKVNDMPFLPYGMDYKQSFHAKVKYLDFENGKGVMFLTQYDLEPSLIDNRRLVYTFQGLSNDGHYYVSATFPVSVPSLPQDCNAESAKGSEILTSLQSDKPNSSGEDYKALLVNCTQRLEMLSSDQYQPTLQLFDDLIESISVRPT